MNFTRVSMIDGDDNKKPREINPIQEIIMKLFVLDSHQKMVLVQRKILN